MESEEWRENGGMFFTSQTPAANKRPAPYGWVGYGLQNPEWAGRRRGGAGGIARKGALQSRPYGIG